MKRKHQSLTLAQKIKIINAYESRGIRKKKDIANDFGVPYNTLLSIIKKQDIIKEALALVLRPNIRFDSNHSHKLVSNIRLGL